MGHGKRRYILLFFFFFTVTFATRALARPPEESEFQAAGIIGEQIGDWVTSQKGRPANIGVFSVHVNPPFDDDYANAIETHIMKGLINHGVENVVPCPECRGPQMTVKDERLIITKGVPDLETLKRIGKDHPVDEFITADIYRTGTNVIANATIYRSQSGQLVNAESFKVPAITFAQSSVQVLVTYGVGDTFAEQKTGKSFSTAANLSLLEELGFAKGGLNLGTITGSPNLIYLLPTLEFRGFFGHSGLGWSLNLGAGYAFNSDGKGAAFRASYELYLGSLTDLGFEALYFMPQDSTVKTITGYAGLHVGLSIGR